MFFLSLEPSLGILLKLSLCKFYYFKVDREDHFWRPGFLHIIICIFLGYKVSNFVKKLDVTDVLKPKKFEGFDRESPPRPFQTMFSRSDFFAFFVELKPYGQLLHIME